MELQHCKTCGHEVSVNASACPHCGDPDPVNRVLIAELEEKSEIKQGCLGFIKHAFGLYIFYAILGMVGSLSGVHLDNLFFLPVSLLGYFLLVTMIRKVRKKKKK